MNLILYVIFMVFLTAYCLLLSSYLDTRSQEQAEQDLVAEDKPTGRWNSS